MQYHMNMRLHATSVSAICKRVQQPPRACFDCLIIDKQPEVDLFEIVDVYPGKGFNVGDIVMSRATGTDVEDDGVKYNVQSLDNLIGKVVENG